MKRNKVALNKRRKGALERNIAQLKSGTKSDKSSIVPLTENDIKRLKREINTLTSKITHNENK